MGNVILKLSVSILCLGSLVSGCSAIKNAQALEEKQERFDYLEALLSEADANDAENQTQNTDGALEYQPGEFRSSSVADMPSQGKVSMEGGVLFGNDNSRNALLALLDGEIDFGPENPTVFGKLSEVQQVDLTSSSNYDTVNSAKLFDGVATFKSSLDPDSTTLSVSSEDFIDRTITYRNVEYLIEFESGGQLYGDGAEGWAVGDEDNFTGTLTNTQTGAEVSYEEGKWGMATPE